MENNVIIAYMNNIIIYTETISKNIKKAVQNPPKTLSNDIPDTHIRCHQPVMK